MSDVYYDQYSVEINADPYPVYRRLREEAPVYYNDTHDFFAVSRFEDVEKGLLDAQTYISGKGAILEMYVWASRSPFSTSSNRLTAKKSWVSL